MGPRFISRPVQWRCVPQVANARVCRQPGQQWTVGPIDAQRTSASALQGFAVRDKKGGERPRIHVCQLRADYCCIVEPPRGCLAFLRSAHSSIRNRASNRFSTARPSSHLASTAASSRSTLSGVLFPSARLRHLWLLVLALFLSLSQGNGAFLSLL